MNQFEKINHFEYLPQNDETMNLMASEFFDIQEPVTNPTNFDYIHAHQISPQEIRLISLIDIEHPLIYKQDTEIAIFALDIKNYYYHLVIIDIKCSMKVIKIKADNTFEKMYEFSISILPNSITPYLENNIISLSCQELLILIHLNQQYSSYTFKTKIIQLQLVRNNTFFILTEDEKLYIMNEKLQLLNEHNLKYTDKQQIKFAVYDKQIDLCLFTISTTKRIMFWQFQGQDFHNSILSPMQTLKIQEKTQGKFVNFMIDSMQNLIFIVYQHLNHVKIYVALINLTKEVDSCIFSIIKEKQTDIKSSSFFWQMIIPEKLVDQFNSGTQFESEEDYINFQQKLKQGQNDYSVVLDENYFCTYMFMMKTEENVADHKLFWYWYFSDQLFYLAGGEIKLATSNSLVRQGSKALNQAQLPPFLENLMKHSIEPKQHQSTSNSQDDPVKKAAEILEKDLIPRVQQQQISEICNDVRNELSEDPQFMFAIKDLIEEQIKKEMDKSSNLQDHQQMLKLEQQFKNDIQQLEGQMETVINQNLEIYAMTCETFILDNFNQQYFESLIEDKIQYAIKLQLNQQLQTQQSTLVQTTKDYFENELSGLYQQELLKMSKSVLQIFEKVTQYFNDINYSDQVKQKNLNQMVDSLNNQLQQINSNIQQLLENHKPDVQIQQKLDNVIQQTEQLSKHVEEFKHQKQPHQNKHIQQQQVSKGIENPTSDRLAAIEDCISQLRNDVLSLFSSQGIKPNDDKFVKNMTAQLTQMQIKLTQPLLNVQQLQEILQQLILQFQFFILKADTSQ